MSIPNPNNNNKKKNRPLLYLTATATGKNNLLFGKDQKIKVVVLCQLLFFAVLYIFKTLHEEKGGSHPKLKLGGETRSLGL